MSGVHVREFGFLLTCISWDVMESQSSGVFICGLWKLCPGALLSPLGAAWTCGRLLDKPTWK